MKPAGQGRGDWVLVSGTTADPGPPWPRRFKGHYTEAVTALLPMPPAQGWGQVSFPQDSALAPPPALKQVPRPTLTEGLIDRQVGLDHEHGGAGHLGLLKDVASLPVQDTIDAPHHLLRTLWSSKVWSAAGWEAGLGQGGGARRSWPLT